MSIRRLATVVGGDLEFNFQRPLFWVLVIVIGIMSFGLSSGNVRIQSGDSTVGGDQQVWITSEFATGQMMPLVVFLVYSFFVAIAAGMSVPRDDELNVGPVLHSTKLTGSEYILGKFSSALIMFLVVLALHVLLQAFFNHVVPNSDAENIRGPFALESYVRPAVVFALPMIVFLVGTSLAVGELTRKPILIFFMPIALLLVCIFFLWGWSPAWLAPFWQDVLKWVEPSGFRWIHETWIQVDRGVDFYNLEPIPYDRAFLISRLCFVLVGIVAAVVSGVHFSRTLRGRQGVARRTGDATAAPSTGDISYAPLRNIGMASRAPGWLTTLVNVARFETSNLKSQPGIYLFVPLILLQTIGSTFFQVGAFDTPMLLTSGTAAVQSMNTLTLLICMLLLFYTVESIVRERNTRLDAIYNSAPFGTLPMLFGKAIANSVLGVAVIMACLVGALLVIVAHHDRFPAFAQIWLGIFGALLLGRIAWAVIAHFRKRDQIRGNDPTPVRRFLAGAWIGVQLVFLSLLLAMIAFKFMGNPFIEFGPFALVWGLLLVPTFLAWTAFVVAVYSLTSNRYVTYAIGIGAWIFTGWKTFRGEVHWVGNWNLWDSTVWSDFGSIEPNVMALLLNRVFYLAVTGCLLVLAVRLFPRRTYDGTRILDRLRFGPRLFRATGPVALAAIPALVVGTVLFVMITQGFQSEAVERRNEEYWSRNYTTWIEADTPHLAGVDVDLEVEPATGAFHVDGTYQLTNWTEAPMRRFPMTVGDHFKDVTWTLHGDEFEPESRARLFVFDLDPPLAAGDTLEVGFTHSGALPAGITRNGGGMDQFILPTGVVLTSFSTSFLPLPFFEEGRGVDDDNELVEPDYPDDFYVGETGPAFGGGSWYPVRTRITGPKEYRYHGVGVLVDDVTSGDQRTMTWETDHPVSFFNVVAGQWDERRGEHTVIYHLPEHTFNIDEMIEALDGARTFYSKWFYPYPWSELKLSEFPGIAGYAQGFPTNITFSEQIGFLTRSTADAQAAFTVTAHEAAHQWWGNMILPGDGPGGNILSEGMAHYSTILLTEQINGVEDRIGFCTSIEARYGEGRRVDGERPMVEIDGTRAGDGTVQYDKGGFVFWMMQNHVGVDSMHAGLHAFIDHYWKNPDHPVLQDLVDTMRPFAADSLAYETFVEQWFFDVVLPQYAFDNALKEFVGGRWRVSATIENLGTGRMPVEVAAVAGERFDDEGDADWQESRITVELGEGDSQTVEVWADFEPERVVVDPDVKVLMLLRDQAFAELASPSS